MSSQGFIMLHRSIVTHWLYEEKRKFSKYEAWIDLLLMVNYKDNKIVQDGKLIEVKRGERITSIRQLMDRWSWSNTKVVNFLEILKKDGMINFEVTPKKKTLIKIVKYEQYQGFQTFEQSVKQTQERQETDSETTQNNINNKENKEKKENNKDYTSKIKDLLTVYSNIPDFINLNKTYWDCIRETRTTGKIAQSVIFNTMTKWKKYDPVVVQYALKTHIEAHAGKEEKYTIGIMRGTTKEEALDLMNRKIVKKENVEKQDPRDIDIAFSKWCASGFHPDDFDWKTGKGIEH